MRLLIFIVAVAFGNLNAEEFPFQTNYLRSSPLGEISIISRDDINTGSVFKSCNGYVKRSCGPGSVGDAWQRNLKEIEENSFLEGLRANLLESLRETLAQNDMRITCAGYFANRAKMTDKQKELSHLLKMSPQLIKYKNCEGDDKADYISLYRELESEQENYRLKTIIADLDPIIHHTSDEGLDNLIPEKANVDLIDQEGIVPTLEERNEVISMLGKIQKVSLQTTAHNLKLKDLSSRYPASVLNRNNLLDSSGANAKLGNSLTKRIKEKHLQMYDLGRFQNTVETIARYQVLKSAIQYPELKYMGNETIGHESLKAALEKKRQSIEDAISLIESQSPLSLMSNASLVEEYISESAGSRCDIAERLLRKFESSEASKKFAKTVGMTALTISLGMVLPPAGIALATVTIDSAEIANSMVNSGRNLSLAEAFSHNQEAATFYQNEAIKNENDISATIINHALGYTPVGDVTAKVLKKGLNKAGGPVASFVARTGSDGWNGNDFLFKALKGQIEGKIVDPLKKINDQELIEIN